MSQADFNITTAEANTGATMRSMINSALQALAGCSSGATAPTTTYPYQFWADTTSGYLKMRDVNNTTWISLFKLDGSAGGLFCPIGGPGSTQAFAVGGLTANSDVTINTGAILFSAINTTNGKVLRIGQSMLTGNRYCEMQYDISNACFTVQPTLQGTGYENIKLCQYGGNVIIGTSGSSMLPGSDNAQTNGSGSYRWSAIYAGSGSINTSDARDKTPVSPLTAGELTAAKQLSAEMGTYQFLASVAAKGNAARRHVGMTVQRAIEIMQSNGLDPFAYGFICYDKWDDAFVSHPAIEADPANGVEAKAAWREQTQTAGDRYSFRPDELLMFIARGIDARLAALEAKP